MLKLRALIWFSVSNEIQLTSPLSDTFKHTLDFHESKIVPVRLIDRRAFLQLAVSPEAFFILRSHFASSHACLCICQYILGIGDRHLSNFLVDMETGRMIGIDFGHAFGSATQVIAFFLYCFIGVGEEGIMKQKQLIAVHFDGRLKITAKLK